MSAETSSRSCWPNPGAYAVHVSFPKTPFKNSLNPVRNLGKLPTMLRLWFAISIIAFLAPARAAERLIEFSRMKANEPALGFRSALMGSGRSGEWKIMETEVPPIIPLNSPKAEIPKQNVLAQVSRDPTDNRYPLFILDDQEFGDFTLTTRFKLAAGVVEQMAGIAFRMQNESNYFYIRASGLYNTLRFIPVVNGELRAPVGRDIEIPKGVFNELKIQCTGNQIRCWLNGAEALPALSDATVTAGKIAFWTKSDSVTYFTDTLISYKPRESLASILAREAKDKHSRVQAVRIVARQSDGSHKIIAGTRTNEIGAAANEVETDVIKNDKKYVGKNKEENFMIATLPLHDKNGDVIAAVRFELERFPGQTEKNVLARTLPIVRDMEARVAANKELSGLQ
jgi:hypothetical protein